MGDYVLMLCALLTASVFSYGAKALHISAIAVLTCVICRKAGELLFKNSEPANDLSSLVTGLMLAMLLPASATWWMAVCAGIFATVVCVLPFGTAGKAPFVPAAGAVAFLSLCWPERMFLYPEIGEETYFGAAEAGASLTSMLSQNNSIGRNPAVILEILTGRVPSAMGAGCVIVLLGALVYLAIRKPRNAVSPVCFILSAALTALLFPRVGTGRLVSLIMELCGGMLLFSAVFFMSYPSVMPARLLPRALWGFAGGIICMLTRYFGFLEETVCFGILITDALSELFDHLPLTKREKKKLKKEEVCTEAPVTVVPEEILNEIPDAPEDEAPEEEPEETETAVDLETVISEENTVDETETPFMTGGESDE